MVGLLFWLEPSASGYALPALLINWSSRLMCRCWAGMSWFWMS
jgi:hypothetical protein